MHVTGSCSKISRTVASITAHAASQGSSDREAACTASRNPNGHSKTCVDAAIEPGLVWKCHLE